MANRTKSQQTVRNRREQLRIEQEAAAVRQRRNRIIGALAGVLVLVLVAIVVGYALSHRKNADDQAKGAQVVPPRATQAKDAIVANPGKAKSGAPVLVEFHDYQCGGCKAYHQTFGPIFRQLAESGDIQYEMRTMTFLDAQIHNNSSVPGAVAAACADTVGHYFDYFDAIYDNSPAEGVDFTATQLREEWPAKAGITGSNLTKFQQCYDTRATLDFVQNVDELASKTNVRTTPTFWVNGKVLDLKTVNPTRADVLAAITRTASS